MNIITHSSSQNSSKKPSHSVFFIKKDNEEESRWIKVGSAWPHHDGEGLNLIVSILGVDVSLTLRKNQNNM